LQQLEEQELPENAPQAVNQAHLAALQEQVNTMTTMLANLTRVLPQALSNMDRPGAAEQGGNAPQNVIRGADDPDPPGQAEDEEFVDAQG
jgi:hypothetical protein